MEYYSAVKRNAFESVLMRLMNLESIVQSEVSQKEKDKYHILTHIYMESIFFFNFYFILLYNTVLVLPYIDMNPPRVYMRSQTWIPLLPPSPQHPSGSSPCTSPKHAIWNLEKWYWRIYFQDSSGETDIENRLVDMGKGEERVRCMERVTWKLTLPYVK